MNKPANLDGMSDIEVESAMAKIQKLPMPASSPVEKVLLDVEVLRTNIRKQKAEIDVAYEQLEKALEDYRQEAKHFSQLVHKSIIHQR